MEEAKSTLESTSKPGLSNGQTPTLTCNSVLDSRSSTLGCGPFLCFHVQFLGKTGIKANDTNKMFYNKHCYWAFGVNVTSPLGDEKRNANHTIVSELNAESGVQRFPRRCLFYLGIKMSHI